MAIFYPLPVATSKIVTFSPNLQKHRTAQTERMPTSRRWQNPEDPTRRSSRVSKPRVVLAKKKTRATGLRKLPNSSGVQAGVEAAVAAASVEDTEEVCAAGWFAARRVRDAQVKSGVNTPHSPNAGGPNAGGAGATAQQVQDLNVVVVGVLDREKVLKQRLKAMDERENGRTLNLHKLCFLLVKRLQALQADVDAMK